MKLRNKKASIEMSFGVLFSIIMIIFVVAIAIYVVVKFIGIGNCGKIASSKDDIQKTVDNVVASDEANRTLSIFLPTGIKQVCFVDKPDRTTSIREPASNKLSQNDYNELKRYFNPKYNIYFSPAKEACEMIGGYVRGINVTKMVEKSGENPYCIENIKGRAKLVVKIGFGENLARIERG